MINQPTFFNIENFSTCVEDNEFFSQYTNHDLPDRYDSNYVLLKYAPSLSEFQLIEEMHRSYQESIHQKHVHFHWPENVGLFISVLDYLNAENYEIGMLELQHLQLQDYISKSINPNIKVQKVNQETFNAFLDLNHIEDLKQGPDFAKWKSTVYRYQYSLPHVQFLLATSMNQPVGSLVLVESKHYLELDNVLTADSFRHKGIASTLIESVFNLAKQKSKSMILIVDAEDTPKNMYEKKGFKTISKQIHVQKSIN